MRVARAFRLPITAIMTALALSGCMRPSAPVAVAQPQADLDSIAYGEPYRPAPRGVADSGGAIGALRSSFAAAPRRYYAPVPVTYLAILAGVAAVFVLAAELTLSRRDDRSP